MTPKTKKSLEPLLFSFLLFSPREASSSSTLRFYATNGELCASNAFILFPLAYEKFGESASLYGSSIRCSLLLGEGCLMGRGLCR